MSPPENRASDSASPGLVLGTAGHIDHGKTALIGALTGVNTDRLPEEKERGITIELGFAPLDLGEGLHVSVVDVPGHERLVRTMVSGATGIDLVLLVVAADEGVMPQTREHVAICDLLGIDRGVVALTKIDVADEEVRELAAEEVSDLLAETSLANADVVPVSAVSGEGIEALREALAKALAESSARTPRAGPARLAIDRVFAMRGFGAVVTGTLIGGALKVGQQVEIYPSGVAARIRGLQSHGEFAQEVAPGVRCAVNLQGVEVADLSRGETLTRKGALLPTLTADLRVDWLPTAPEHEGVVAIEFLAGTAKRLARLAPIGVDRFVPGEACFARLHVEGDPVPLLPGDRFIARGFSRREGTGGTLGGGLVLDVAPPRRRRSDPALLRELTLFAEQDPVSAVRERIARSGLGGARRGALLLETGLDAADLDAVLQAIGPGGDESACPASDLWIASRSLQEMKSVLTDTLDAFHAAEPLRPGMSRSALRGSLPENVAPEATNLALEALAEAGAILVEADLVRAANFAPTLDRDAEATIERIEEEAADCALDPPAPREWAERLGVAPDRFRDLLAHLERAGSLVRAPGDLWFDKAAVDSLEQRVRSHFREHDELDTPTYKSLIGTSRRTAVPLMELFDDRHVTRRRDNVRVLFKS
jgi:selenocysteine-specific elongation factor